MPLRLQVMIFVIDEKEEALLVVPVDQPTLLVPFSGRQAQIAEELQFGYPSLHPRTQKPPGSKVLHNQFSQLAQI